MKKALLVAISAVLVSTAAFADGEQSAKSVNAVGVIKYTLPANAGLTCISLPLNPLDGDGSDYWVWGDTSVAQQLPEDSYVYFWSGSGWKPFKKYPEDVIEGGWADTAKNRQIKPGEAIFIKGPKGDPERTISLLGELPVEGTRDFDLTGTKNLDTMGALLYPVSGTFGDSELAAQLEEDDYVYFWTGSGWKPFKKYPEDVIEGGWADAPKARVLKVGEGVFVRRATSATTITNERPFDWED